MKRIISLVLVFMVCSSHDLFIKLDSYFLTADTDVELALFNGTFNKSDNVITRDRMLDVSIIGNASRIQVDSSQWSDLDSTTSVLHFKTGSSATYLAGVSTKARNIAMEASDFNDYLEHDGVLDVLEQRKESGTLDQNALEKYSKHVKAVFQAGDKLTDDWKTILDYPIEFVPKVNPYALAVGDEMEVQLLRNGEPLSNQLVYAGFENEEHTHSSDHDHGDHSHDEQQGRTDENGNASFTLDHSGLWYIRTIHLVETNEDSLTHESNWATLSFEIKAASSSGNISMVLILSLLVLAFALIYFRKMFQ